jgi:hypothetical protein
MSGGLGIPSDNKMKYFPFTSNNNVVFEVQILEFQGSKWEICPTAVGKCLFLHFLCEIGWITINIAFWNELFRNKLFFPGKSLKNKNIT